MSRLLHVQVLYYKCGCTATVVIIEDFSYMHTIGQHYSSKSDFGGAGSKFSLFWHKLSPDDTTGKHGFYRLLHTDDDGEKKSTCLVWIAHRLYIGQSDNLNCTMVSRSSWCALTGHQISLYVEHMACCLLLVTCALLSIVCPLPSFYPIIVSVVPPVSPLLPSFVSLFSLLVSVVLC